MKTILQIPGPEISWLKIGDKLYSIIDDGIYSVREKNYKHTGQAYDKNYLGYDPDDFKKDWDLIECFDNKLSNNYILLREVEL